MNSIFAALAVLSMAAGAPGSGASAGKGEAAGNQASKASEDATGKAERKVCRTYENTESRMKRTRLCLTKAEWKKFERME